MGRWTSMFSLRLGRMKRPVNRKDSGMHPGCRGFTSGSKCWNHQFQWFGWMAFRDVVPAPFSRRTSPHVTPPLAIQRFCPVSQTLRSPLQRLLFSHPAPSASHFIDCHVCLLLTLESILLFHRSQDLLGGTS